MHSTKLPALAARSIVALVFLGAAFSKLNLPQKTLASVYAYQIPMPGGLAIAIAAALPWFELLLALALLLGFWKRETLLWSTLLLGGFTLLTAHAWWRGLPIDCGCLDWDKLHPALKALSTPGGATLRNLVLLGLLAILWRSPRRSPQA